MNEKLALLLKYKNIWVQGHKDFEYLIEKISKAGHIYSWKTELEKGKPTGWVFLEIK
jgi:hypothetical protein